MNYVDYVVEAWCNKCQKTIRKISLIDGIKCPRCGKQVRLKPKLRKRMD